MALFGLAPHFGWSTGWLNGGMKRLVMPKSLEGSRIILDLEKF